MVVALKVLVEGVEADVGQKMTKGFVVAVARGEVKAVETAEIEDGSACWCGPGRRRWSQFPDYHLGLRLRFLGGGRRGSWASDWLHLCQL